MPACCAADSTLDPGSWLIAFTASSLPLRAGQFLSKLDHRYAVYLMQPSSRARSPPYVRPQVRLVIVNSLSAIEEHP
jgi:hypothetical protein